MSIVTPTVSKIMIIRHAEKPTTGFDGVDADGSENAEALIVAGWQRSGGLLALFNPARGPLQSTELKTPGTIIASWTSATSGSQRPYQTVATLAEELKLGKHHWLQFDKKDIKGAVKAALAAEGTALISWQHEDIPAIALEVAKKTGLAVNPVPPSPWPPPSWPDSRFDLVWVMDLVAGDPSTWSFTQVPQLLMPGDSPDVITGSGA